MPSTSLHLHSSAPAGQAKTFHFELMTTHTNPVSCYIRLCVQGVTGRYSDSVVEMCLCARPGVISGGRHLQRNWFSTSCDGLD